MKYYKITTSLPAFKAKLRIRAEPRLDSRVIGLLAQGESLPMKNLEGGDWMLVYFRGGTTQGYCLSRENGMLLLEALDEDYESVKVESGDSPRDGVENIVVVHKSSPISSTTSSNASDGCVYYVNTMGVRNRTIPSPCPHSPPSNEIRGRSVSWWALPGPAQGLYLTSFDATDSEEYMSDNDEIPARTGWTPVKREGRKIFAGIDATLALLFAVLDHVLQLVLAVILVLVVAASLMTLLVFLRGLNDGCSMTLDTVRIAS
jgi:hypothetical protein